MITYDDAKRTLLELVEEKGADYVYVRPNGYDCVYSTSPDDGSQPSCIVGHVIARLDPEAFKMVSQEEWEFVDDGHGEWVSNPVGASTLIEYHPEVFGKSPELLYLLTTAQGVQDAGRSWGEAVRDAIETVEG